MKLNEKATDEQNKKHVGIKWEAYVTDLHGFRPATKCDCHLGDDDNDDDDDDNEDDDDDDLCGPKQARLSSCQPPITPRVITSVLCSQKSENLNPRQLQKKDHQSQVVKFYHFHIW